MILLRRLTAIFISIGLGAVFIISGYTKLFPLVETFEFTFVEIRIANWYTAPIFARAIIGLEFFVGVLLLLNYRLKKFTLPLSIGLLLFFIIYLVFQIYISGNETNCGCFGERFKMTPLQAIVKNIIMIVGALIVYFLYEGWKTRYHSLLISLCAVTTLGLPFIVNPVYYKYSSNNLEEKINYKLDLDLLYDESNRKEVEKPLVELRKGKYVLAFLSLTCPHCKIAARKLGVIKKNNPQLPIYFLLNGERSQYENFITETRANNIPSSFCLGKTFIQLASSMSLPRLFYIDNSVVVKKVDYYELNQYQIEDWVKKNVLQ